MHNVVMKNEPTKTLTPENTKPHVLKTVFSVGRNSEQLMEM
jgi:hypothetical protein